MDFKQLHSWELTPKEVPALQKQLASQIDNTSPLKNCALVAGADASYSVNSEAFYAAVVVMRVRDCAIVEIQHAARRSPFPYVPGMLSFREAPVLLDAFAKVRSPVELVFLDGQGYAHPRRLGLASHVGLWLDVPTIGCAKSRLCGTYVEPGNKAGSVRYLKDKDEIIGRIVRTKSNVKPLYISVGHRIDLSSAVRWTLRMCRGYRMPEPTRQAHLEVNRFRKNNEKTR